ncbi:Aste57867_11181 [Aphanomyces stellatus]|uniref:Aste57867_11181 protein n=1 Tax=Aphanomyces stellatus TaxID=120398 RepID=A0A485KSA5_9STRA|nr:hypothetical protein As57867_011139 [Aphanomyces stellatus]VFT88048.1 Aste57867_11181 [Aphanomyces stellatus]
MEMKAEGDANKLLQRITKMVQTASVKKHGLTRMEVFSILQECLSPEATTPCKVLGFRLASLGPSCITTEVWQFILDAAVKELAGASTQGSAPVLLHAIPVFDVLPLTLILGFLQQQEMEPLKKFQACVSHESIDVRCVALATFSRVSILCTKVLFARGLTRFPFDSNEARIIAQQDVTSILTDIWKLNVQAAEVESPAVAGVAFENLTHLFARGHAIRALSTKQPRQEGGLDELISWVFNQAYPRFDILKSNAQKLLMESQLYAMKWLSMVAYLMMQKSGACTPGIAIAIMEVDTAASDDGNDEKSTIKVRADLVASELVESWFLPAYVLVTANASLTQAYPICEAIAIVMQHPLQLFNRLKWSSVLVARLTAIIHSSTMVRQRQDVIRLQVLLLDSTNTYDFTNVLGSTIESISAVDDATTRLQLTYDLWHAMLLRVCRKQQFDLLESICASEYFHGLPTTTAPHKGKTNRAYEIFRALIEALLFGTHPSLPLARLVVLKSFVAVLANKSTNDLRTATLVLYTSLLTQLCLESPAPAVLEFLHQVVLPLAPKVPSANVRVQLYWLGLKYVQETANLQSIKWIEAELLMLQSSDDGTGLLPSTANDSILGGDNAPVLDAHLIQRFHALVLCLKWFLAQDVSVKQYAAQLLTHVRSKNPSHRVLCDTITQTLDEVAATDTCGLRHTSAFVLPELFAPASLFPARTSATPSIPPVKWKEEVECVVTGACDPLCLKISYREPEDHIEEIALCVTCCNVTNVAWSDFSISVGVTGPVKLVDTSNNMHIRATGEVKPHGMFKSEKLYRFLRFSRARFYFRVVLEPSSPELPPTVLGLSNPYHMPFDALLHLPEPTLWTASYYQKAWQTAESNKVYKVKASPGMKLVPNQHVKVAFITDMSVDTHFLVQMSFLTWTKWKECICATISCALDVDGGWHGTLELRAPHAVLVEVDKTPRDFLSVLAKTALELEDDVVVEKPVACVSPRHQIMKRSISVDVMAKDPTGAASVAAAIATTPTVTRRALMSFFGKN